MTLIQDPKDDLERIHAVLGYMVTPVDPITFDKAAELLFPLLEGSPALERAIKANGAGMLARNAETAMKERRGVFRKD